MLAHTKKHVLQTLSALQPCLSLSSSGPLYDFVAPHSFNVYFVWGDFPYRYHSFSGVWKEAKSMLAPLFALLLT